MANKNQILPTGGEQPGRISPQLQDVLRQTRGGEPVALAPPPVITEEIRRQREQLEAAGQLPADISGDQIMDGLTAGGLKLQNVAAKYFPDLALEKLGREDYFPSFRPVEEVGVVSGRIIGRQPIFVKSGGLFPFGIIDARKRALERAAQIKLAAQSAFLEGGPEGPAQYQRDLNNSWYDFVNRTGQKLGWDFTRAKGDPEIMREASKHYTLAKELTFMTESAKGILDDATTKEKFVPSEIANFATEIWSGAIKFEDILAYPEKFVETSRNLQSYVNLMNVIRTEGLPMFEDQVSQIISAIPNEAAEKIMIEDDYDLIVKTLKDYVDPVLMEGWAGFLKNNHKLFQNKKEVQNALEKVLGNRIKQELFAVRKLNLAATSARRKKPEILTPGPGSINVRNIKRDPKTGKIISDEVMTMETFNHLKLSGTSSQPRDINISPTKFYDLAGDEIIKDITGIVKADVVDVFSALTNPKTGSIVAPGGKIPEDTRGLKQQQFALIKVGPDEDDATDDLSFVRGQAVLIPFENIEASVERIFRWEKGQWIVEPIEGEEQGEKFIFLQ